MAIEIFAKTKLEDLADRLIDEVAAEQMNAGLFHKTEIIVPNKGIAKFLSQRFAERKGITAGIEYPYLMSWVIRRVFRMHAVKEDHGDETSETADFLADIRPNTIAWRIFQHLPALLQYREFASLRRFLLNKEPERLWDLSTVLGNQFDTIMLQRPDWICAWENNQVPEDIAQHRSDDVKSEALMQGILWNTIATPDWKGNHFAAKLLALQNNTDAVQMPHFQNPVRIFGFSSIPESIFILLEKHLSKDSEIQIYSFEPCDNLFWGDAKSKKEELTELEWNWFNSDNEFSAETFNSLAQLYFKNNMIIGSFARNAREFFIRTANYRSYDENALENDPDPVTGDILRTAQNLIKSNSDSGNDGTTLPDPGWKNTLQIHSCYSPFREVEAAHDFLQERFAEDKDLCLKDVFILSADPELYAPLVDAVFNNPTISDVHRLNVSIADMQASNIQSSLIAFFQLLEFWKTDFTANDVFALLRQNGIMQKAGFTEEGLLLCSRRVDEAGIRWGWNKTDRMEQYQYPYKDNTWHAGFDRMLTAYAFDEADAVLNIDGCENIYAAAAPGEKEDLGRLIAFTTALHTSADRMREKNTQGCDLTEWTAFLLDTADRFFPSGSPIHSALRCALNNLRLDLNTLEEPPMLTSGIMLKTLKEKINTQQSNRNFMTGNITFCSLRPMRSIPAKIICLLGMDHDKFPKSGIKYGFDLIRSVPRIGDHDNSLDERQLFLDLILSARDHLFISYTGQGIRDNKSRPPSPCVEELYQWLCSVFGERECFRLRHPLQAFSRKYFTEGSPLRSHSEILCKGAEYLAAMTDAPARIYPAHQAPLSGPLPDDLSRLTLADLQAFFRNPAETFFSKRLKVRNDQGDSIELSDEESLAFKADWYLKDELLTTLNKQGILTGTQLVEHCVPKLRADAKLPLPPYGEKLFAADPLPGQLLALNDKLKCLEQYEKVICEAADKHIELDDGTKLTLHLPEITLYKKADDTQTLLQAIPVLNALYTQNHLELRIAHAAACAMLKEPVQLTTTMYFLDEKNGISASCSSDFDGMSYLEPLLRLYVEGMKRILPFIPNTSYACWKAAREHGETGEEAYQKMQEAIAKEWNNGYNKQGDVERYGMYFGPEPPLPEHLLPAVKVLFDPLSCHKETFNKRKKATQQEEI